MEASGAGQAAGDAVAIVLDIFEEGDVVELYHVDSDTVLRVGADAELVGRRTAGEGGIVGFDGLVDGDHYFAKGYSRGRLEERRIVARQLDDAVVQPGPVQAPQTLGPEQTPIEDVPSAEQATSVPPEPAEGEQPLPVGLPEGVTSPVAEPPAPDTAEPPTTSPTESAGPAQPTTEVTGTETTLPNESTKLGGGDVTLETNQSPSSTSTEAPADAPQTDAQGQPVEPPPAPAVDPSAPVAAEDQAPPAPAEVPPAPGAVEGAPPADVSVPPDAPEAVAQPDSPVADPAPVEAGGVTVTTTTTATPTDPQTAPEGTDAPAQDAPPTP